MPVSVYVAELNDAGAGRMTATAVIQPSELTGFRVEILFDDAGSDEGNLHYVQSVLQRFSNDLAEALRQPLKIAPRPAAG